jgi:hypothetical protein
MAQWFIRNDFVYLIERVKLYVLEPYPSSSKNVFLAMRGHLEGGIKNIVLFYCIIAIKFSFIECEV